MNGASGVTGKSFHSMITGLMNSDAMELALVTMGKFDITMQIYKIPV